MKIKVLMFVLILTAGSAQAGWYSAMIQRCFEGKCYLYNYYVNINPPPTYHF